MTFPGRQAELTNWSKSACSPCFVYQASSVTDITRALAAARAQGLSVIPHGAGHSYTDAALNTAGLVIDVTPMRRVLSWDAARGVMRVEPGVTLQEMVRVASPDGWWPFVTPSTPEVTIGGCVAMNVNGKNAWKWGPFGAHVLSLDVMLASGDMCMVAPGRDPQLFQAIVGSMGLLGIITSITVQLQRVSSGFVDIRKRPCACFAEIFSLFAEEEWGSDYMEAWFDGFARGDQLGRGVLTCARLIDSDEAAPPPWSVPGAFDRLGTSFVNLAARLGRPALMSGVRLADGAIYGWGGWSRNTTRRSPLSTYTFWPSAAFASYHAMFPEGAETFHAFVPEPQVGEIFPRLLRYSQGEGCMPLWCIIKRHRRDPFLLSYQVDGFSLELNYHHTHQTAQKLKQVLEHMIAMVVEAGGKFYLAKDHYLTHVQYRRSVGDEAVDSFLRLKQCYDPGMLLQSDLFRRLFRPSM